MKDFKAISKNYFRKIKSSIGLKTEYAKIFKEADADYYETVFSSKPLVLENFLQFLDSHKTISSILEIGCSTGIFPIKYNQYFSDKKYTGLDISQKCIDYCKNHSTFNFICENFLKKEVTEKWDLVFAFDVIDHVYDVELFIKNLVKSTKKYAYVAAYYGYFPNLDEHSRKWDDKDGIYFNSLSVKHLAENLRQNGLTDDEFTIRPQLQGFGDVEHTETIIEIHRKGE